ncbi:hypothetical protein BpHYR1_011319 [Brachionus plicatilis]|uniref:Uncharacterized protein n=1 Tax=Brachionus plicatilis TaxID=10195 RepID=A0A3M7Q2I6_BRAPC|nr:hypothetical protein BpHYR1_011319 [Brachionus plicatilis]
MKRISLSDSCILESSLLMNNGPYGCFLQQLNMVFQEHTLLSIKNFNTDLLIAKLLIHLEYCKLDDTAARTLDSNELNISSSSSIYYKPHTVYPCSEMRALKPEYQRTMSLNLVKMMKNFKKYSTSYWGFFFLSFWVVVDEIVADDGVTCPLSSQSSSSQSRVEQTTAKPIASSSPSSSGESEVAQPEPTQTIPSLN